MPAWGVVLLLLVAGVLSGWLVVRRFGARRPTLPLLFAALTLGLAGIGWLALVLAEVGLFSIGRLALLWAALVAVLLATEAVSRRSGRAASPLPDGDDGAATPLFPRLPAWLEVAFLGAWLFVAAWLFFRPHEYVLGAADAGVYVSLGASIAREGSIVLQSETLAGLDEALYPVLLRPQPDNPVAPYYLWPGFYVTGRPLGEITPQFYPLHPVWQAVAFDGVWATSGGAAAPTPDAIRAALLLNGLWATLGALAVYFLVRYLAGWETAALALVALSLTGLQVWFARYPTTEVLTQYLLWAGLWALGMWLGKQRPGPLWALTAGVCLGMVYLVRIDLLVMLPLLALLVGWLLVAGRRAAPPAEVVWFVAPLALLIGHSFFHAWLQSRPYFVVHAGLGLQLLLGNWVIPAAGLAAGVAFLWLARRAGPRAAAAYARHGRSVLLALIGLVLVAAVYGWFVRPVAGAASVRPDPFAGGTIPLLDHENWRRLGWYLSPLGVWLGVVGVCALIWRGDRRTAMTLAIGCLFAALYLWTLNANPHHVYAMRRFVPAVVPFFTVAAAMLIGWLARRPAWWARAAAGLLAVLWLGGLAWSARGFVTQVDHRGLAAQVETLNDAFAPGSVLLFYDGVPIGNGDFFGTPLQFIYGHDAFALRDPVLPGAALVDAIEVWHNNGRAVYWIGNPAWPMEHGLAAETNTYTLASLRLESSYDHKPTLIEDDEWRLTVTRLAQP